MCLQQTAACERCPVRADRKLCADWAPGAVPCRWKEDPICVRSAGSWPGAGDERGHALSTAHAWFVLLILLVLVLVFVFVMVMVMVLCVCCAPLCCAWLPAPHFTTGSLAAQSLKLMAQYPPLPTGPAVCLSVCLCLPLSASAVSVSVSLSLAFSGTELGVVQMQRNRSCVETEQGEIVISSFVAASSFVGTTSFPPPPFWFGK